MKTKFMRRLPECGASYRCGLVSLFRVAAVCEERGAWIGVFF